MVDCEIIKSIISNISADGINATATIIGLIFAIRAYNKWQVEHIGKKKIDLFEKVYPSLKLIEIKFDQIFINGFSGHDEYYYQESISNVDPDDLCDNEFLNHILYKIDDIKNIRNAFNEINQYLFISEAYLDNEMSEIYKNITYIEMNLIIGFSKDNKENLLIYVKKIKNDLSKLNKHICSVIAGKSS